MSAKINDGGPAFPMTGSTANWDAEKGQYVAQYGMTLRDWFAGQALAGLCASTSHDDAPSKKLLADYAWQQSDAMLASRKGASND